MLIKALDINVECVPLSTKQSRYLNSNLQKFTSTLQSTSGVAQTTDGDAAKFLTDQVEYLLTTVYHVQCWEDFEDKITISEVCTFVKEQIKANGPLDFLVQPLLALVMSMENLSKRVIDTVERELEKLSAE